LLVVPPLVEPAELEEVPAEDDPDESLDVPFELEEDSLALSDFDSPDFDSPDFDSPDLVGDSDAVLAARLSVR
jgi:hypothetical protein